MGYKGCLSLIYQTDMPTLSHEHKSMWANVIASIACFGMSFGFLAFLFWLMSFMENPQVKLNGDQIGYFAVIGGTCLAISLCIHFYEKHKFGKPKPLATAPTKTNSEYSLLNANVHCMQTIDHNCI